MRETHQVTRLRDEQRSPIIGVECVDGVTGVAFAIVPMIHLNALQFFLNFLVDSAK